MADTSPESLCPGCFAEKGGANPCPHCGYDERAARGPLLLPHRTLLHEQFLVGRVLGKPGGFGITYLGWDIKLQTRVAIKEYLPRELAGRATDQASIAPHSQDDGDLFRYGLEQFLREARTLAQLDHPNIVRVRHFFEANGTAYLVMDYYEGISLAEHLERQSGRLPEETAKQLLLPILDGLRAVHAKGFLHRDVKPQNIYLARTDTGGVRPILLDFGAARQAMGERSRSLSVVVSAGYAPFEQYHRKGSQGPWTDIYAAAAVLYRTVTGDVPPEAAERRDGDELKPAVNFGASKALSDALSAALAIAPEARPQSVQEFQARLWGGQPLPSTFLPATPTAPDPPLPLVPASADPSPPNGGRRWWVVPAALVPVLALLAVGVWYLNRPTVPPGPSDSERAEDAAYEAARQTDTEAAYRAYLSDCGVNGCGHRSQAERRLEDLAKEADIAAREADGAAYAAAAKADTSDAYQAYLAGCDPHGCRHRDQAEQRLVELKREADLASREADLAAYTTAARTDTVDAYQAYLAACAADGCGHRSQAEARLEALAKQAGAPELVRMDGGCFQMGSPESEEGRDDDERQHRVCVEDFAIGRHEVTVAEFRRFVEATDYKSDAERNAGGEEGCFAYDQSDTDKQWEYRSWASWRKPNKYLANQDDHPVACVSWNDAMAYLKWLNRETGGAYRLPTEAEWEYAARAGTQTARFWGDDPSGACRYANVADRTKLPNNKVWTNKHECSDGHAFASPVGSYRPNPWDLHEMLGNLWEWTCSVYDAEYEGAEQRCANMVDAGSRSLRGGSWNIEPRRVRAALRTRGPPDSRYVNIGFRLAQD